MTFLLVLFLVNADIATFRTTQEICMATLDAHRQGSIVIAWDDEGKQWPAENVWCLEPIEETSQQEPMS